MEKTNKIIRPNLEFYITKMCNLKCLGCTRDSAFIKNHHADFESYKKDLKALSKVIAVKRFRIMGGEPLLSGQLIDYLVAARKSGMFGEIGICTNGLLLFKQNDDLFKHLDFVDVSIYPGVDYEAIRQELLRRQAINPGFKFKLKKYTTFFKVNLKFENSMKKTLKTYQNCRIAHQWSCHTFDEGYYYKCGKPLIQKNYDEIRGIDRHYNRGGIAIHKPDLKKRLIEYINDPKPLEHCKSCLGTSGPLYQHKQLSDLSEGLKFT